MSCGAPLGPGAGPSHDLRKLVTVVFADVTGSTAFGEHADPEAVRAALGRWFEAMCAVLERHGGVVEKFIGDAVVAVFGVPVVHEDDALRAVRAAAEMCTALDTLNADGMLWPDRALEMRTGVNTGEVVVGEARAGGSVATGDAVNVAARLQQAARPGEVLIGESTWRLVRNAVVAEPLRPLAVRGRDAPVGASRLVEVWAEAEAIPRSLRAPLVGRTRELRILRDAFDRAAAGPTSGLVTVLGDAGIGKSRLVREFLADLQAPVLVLRGRCLSYGDGITWWPVTEILRSIAGVHEGDDPEAVRAGLVDALGGAPDADAVALRLAELFSGSAVARRDELFWAVQRLLSRLAAERPVVVVLDDLHWAEPTLLDLVDHVIDWTRDVPLLVLCMARPEMLDARPAWGGGKPNATSLALEPLSAAETDLLVQELTTGAALPAATRDRIAEAADGNPLYLEQVLEMLVDDGFLVPTRTGTIVSGNLEHGAVPPTVRALLAARLDRLAAPERAALERAAVVGKQFERIEVQALTPEAEQDAVPVSLLALVRRGLIRPDWSAPDPGEAFRFRHLLIRDAAYEALPKTDRADLHERFATWLEATGRQIGSLDEIAGHHLSEAVRFRELLRLGEAATAPLRLRAGRRLAAAGNRALLRDDLPAAVRLLERAGGLLAATPREAAESLTALARAHSDGHDTAASAAAARAAVAAAEQSDDTDCLFRARLIEAYARWFVDPAASSQASSRLIEEARAWASVSGDLETLNASARLEGRMELMAGRHDRARAAHERQLDLALRLGRARDADDARRWIAHSLVWGTAPVADAIRRAEALESETSGVFARAFISSRLAMLHAIAGHRDEAARLLAESRAHVEDLGIPRGTVLAPVAVWLFLDDIPSTIASGRELVAQLRAVGDTLVRATAAGWLGLALARAGEIEEATAAADEARTVCSPDDMVGQMEWREAAAAIALARGDPGTAHSLASEAVEIAQQTDEAIDKAEALAILAQACWASGREDEARAALGEAIEIARHRGWQPGLARIKALREELRGATPA
jgi:class 3 adenylate cyclase/tetratricopeptide (TPR) repeat protein